MKKITYIFMLFFLFSTFTSLKAQDMKFYTAKWKQVDNYLDKRLPKSAIKVIDEIYAKAQSENIQDQILKCDIYYLKTKNDFEENAIEDLIVQFEKDIENAPSPNSAILHSIVANLYWDYYMMNLWTINDRTEIANFVPDDIKTWTAENFVAKTIEHYNASIENSAELKKYSMDDYPEMIDEGTEPELFPTLFDFLSYQALQFYKRSEASITRPADYFTINDPVFYEPANVFANAQITSVDTLSLHYNGVKILQNWLKFRLDDNKHLDALIFADLQRINFVETYSVLENSDKYYLKFLQNLEKKYPSVKYTANVTYKIAEYYYQKASEYDPKLETTFKYKNYYNTALEILNKIISQYPDYKYVTDKARNLKKSINDKELSFSYDEILIPNEKFSTLIKYKNIDKIFVEVYRTTQDEYNKIYDKSDYTNELIKNCRQKMQLVKDYSFNLIDDGDKQKHSTEIILDGLPQGFYMIFISNDKDFEQAQELVSYSTVTMSNISFLSERINYGKYYCKVIDRTTSKPIKNAKIKATYSEYSYKKRKYITRNYGNYQTNQNGEFYVKAKDKEWRGLSFFITTDNDSLNIENAFSVSKQIRGKDSYPTRVKFFTDRAIYRPGQTVYFKGIAIDGSSKNPQIVENLNVHIVVKDVNYQKITEFDLKTNEFGTFNGSFAIPQGLLNGTMLISCEYGTTYFQVEEYKRPTFEVEMLSPDKQYLVNQQVTVKGKAENYSGVKLTDATVRYTVKRQNLWFGWWWWNFRSDEVMISHGTTQTDENGEFEINFNAIPDLSMPKNQNTAFNYTISVDVTDINGETQSTVTSVTVGYTALKISTNLDEIIEKQEFSDEYDTLILSTQNINGTPVTASGKMELYLLDAPKTAMRERYGDYPDRPIYTKEQWQKLFPGNEYQKESNYKFWKEKKKVWDKNFDTRITKKYNISKFANLRQGVYKLKIKSRDAFGNDVVAEEYLVIFDKNLKVLPYPTDDWNLQLTLTAEVGDVAEFVVGSFSPVEVTMQVIINDSIMEQKIIKLNNNQELIKIPVKEEYRGDFYVNFICSTRNRIFFHTYRVSVPYTNKKLDFEFVTYRDKLQPGQKEEWKIIIKDKSGDKQLAELLTTMYDASLDAILPHNWLFFPYGTNKVSLSWSYYSYAPDNSSDASFYKINRIPVIDPEYPHLNWFGFSLDRRIYYMKKTTKTGADMFSLSEEAPIEQEEGIADVDDTNIEEDANAAPSPPMKPEPEKELQIRKNFNETAFFYPELRTNENGEVVISFTMPESLTKWHLMGLAHTKDLKIGRFDKYIVTQKELMVMPNAPRFFRQGDTMYFAAKIANLSDKNLSGNVTLEFIDEITGKIYDNVLVKGEKTKKSFTVNAGGNTPVKWKIAIPDDAKLLTYKIIAKSGNFSDGEQKTIPVMTNRILVTETLPLPVRANQTKTFTFDKLVHSTNSKTLKTDKLTVEFTSNPAWYAVQALPYLIEYPYECNEQTFSRYYANALASYIANSSPKIKAVFDTWKNYQPSALMSNLEKNQELKGVLLEETPWVFYAQDENERKHRIALLFDLNTLANGQKMAIKKLKREQSINGGWSWFKGMPESWYITQYIAEGIGHLKRLNVIDETDDVFKMGQKAVGFTDYKMKENYDFLLKYYNEDEMKKLHPSSIIIHYFYTRSFYDMKLNSKYQKAYNYFYGQMKKYWTDYDLYPEAMLALIFHRNGDEKIAQDIVKSLKERALHNDEFGMYWKDNVAGYYWYQNTIQTQAIMIEVFDEVAQDPQSVDELKVWLLKNKQTNDWTTTTSTAEAIYALLLTGGVDMLANSEICPVQLGNTLIDPANNPDIETEAGTGYYKVSYDGSEVTPDMGNITVKNTNNVVAWGAVYWQYFEDMDKITAHETPLKLKKDLFKRIQTDRGDQLVPITNGQELKIGDEVVVRIELRVDRDMEFVHMKDMRAAAFEPIDVISSYRYQDGLGYYQTTKDASTNFFFDFLPKGTYVFEYSLRVSAEGSFSNGITTIQCMYAPEFTSHSKGVRVKVE